MPEQKSLSSMQEFYIRKEGDEDSRGPFTLEQLASLIEAGQVDRQTFYYDSTAEKWVEIQSNAQLVASLFPMKKKLSMRVKETVPIVNVKAPAEEKPITVEDMLAAAEGQTDETKGKRARSEFIARAAHWSMRILSVLFLLSAAGLLVPNMNNLVELDLMKLLTTPEIVFGVLDVLLGVFLFLELTSVYGLVRVRSAVGAGFFAVYFGVIPGHGLLLLAAVTGSLVALFLTLATRLAAVIMLGILGLAAMGSFAYMMLN
jgi:GYF domain 2